MTLRTPSEYEIAQWIPMFANRRAHGRRWRTAGDMRVRLKDFTEAGVQPPNNRARTVPLPSPSSRDGEAT